MKLKQFTFNPFQENTYIVSCEETHECAIIDCGVLQPHEESKLKQYIDDEKLKVVHILNTHLHLDHCFGNAWAADTFNILPAAHKEDEFMLASMEAHAASYGLPMAVKAQKLGDYLTDNQKINIGNITLTVIHTPGHSPGGVCFYAESDELLISGDTLFQGSIGRTDLPGGEYASLIRSVQQRIFTLPEDTKIFPGHGGYTTVIAEKTSNPFF